jgi:3-hydroxybutyryl-CoA dehydrogenase
MRRTLSEPVPGVIAVLGAGTMGAGIAQLAAQAGARTLLCDPVPEALEAGVEKIASGLEKQMAKGELETADAAAARAQVEPVGGIDQLGEAEFVIEAAPERLELKLELFRAVAEVVAAKAVLATNTSSLSVTEIAAGVPGPERVVGLHFFNPAPVMRLVEVVAGAGSSPSALASARAVGEAMGKRVIDAADVAGFLVNRCNRPFSLESLKLLQERVASVEQIDRIVRMGGGFRMGPFELMDLIGIDTHHAVAESFYRQSFGEPRYRPSPLTARQVAAGRLGRKSGRGWYEYGDDAERPADPEPPPMGGGEARRLVIEGELPIAEQLRAAAAAAGWGVRSGAAGGEQAWLIVDCTGEPGRAVAAAAPVAKLLHAGSLTALDPSAAGFHAMAPLEGSKLVELTSTPRTRPEARERCEQLVASLGMVGEHVGDAPGLVLGRVVSQLVNEAAFLIGEGNGSADDVDAGMELGLAHPIGSIRRSEAMGLDHALAVLDALASELGEERYRAAPLLRRRAVLGEGLRG